MLQSIHAAVAIARLPSAPLLVAPLLVPALIAALMLPGTGHAGVSAEHQRCSSCHLGERPAGGEAGAIGRQCASCHGEIAADEARRGRNLPAFQSQGVPQGHAACGSCHQSHANGLPFQVKIADAGLPDQAGLDAVTRLCQTCHGDLANDRGPRGHFVRHPVGLPLVGERRRAAAGSGLPLVDAAGTADPSDDVLSCITCHDMHGGEGAYRLRWAADSEPAACRTCHDLNQPPGRLIARTRL